MGSIIHATEYAPSQLIAEAFGLSKTASSVILAVPALLLIAYIRGHLCAAWRDESYFGRGEGAGTMHHDSSTAYVAYLLPVAHWAFGLSAVIGYFLGAVVADQAGWWAFLAPVLTLLGGFVVLCVVPRCVESCTWRSGRNADEHRRLVQTPEPAFSTTTTRVQVT